MFVSSNYKRLKTLKGKEYDVPANVYYQLKEVKQRQLDKFDNVVIITGGVGSGKSNASKCICGTYQEYFNKKPYTLDNVYFLIEKVLDSLNATDNYGEAINYDEAVQGATGKDGITKIGYILRKAFITKRKKGHLITLCIDNPKELNDKVIERCIAWYHVYYIRTKTGRRIKGLFKVFSDKQLQQVYEDLKKGKVRFVEQHYIYRNNHKSARFKNYSNIFYDEDEYDNKKDQETNLIEGEVEDRFKVHRDLLIEHLSLKGYKHPEIAKIVGLDKTTIGDIVRRRRADKSI